MNFLSDSPGTLVPGLSGQKPVLLFTGTRRTVTGLALL